MTNFIPMWGWNLATGASSLRPQDTFPVFRANQYQRSDHQSAKTATQPVRMVLTFFTSTKEEE
jgi:hypothetical protein